MSRAQETAVVNQAKAQGGTQFGDSQNAYTQTQQDIGGYKSQLGKYAASNPYLPGGEYQTTQNRVLANTADAAATAAGAAAQMQARRTGQNPQGANATAEEIARSGQRELAGEQAAANASRIANEAEYNKGVLGATTFPVVAEAGLAEGMGRLSAEDLATQQRAAETPSFWDTAGSAFASQLGKTLGGGQFNLSHAI